jgi:hypothetical protein
MCIVLEWLVKLMLVLTLPIGKLCFFCLKCFFNEPWHQPPTGGFQRSLATFVWEGYDLLRGRTFLVYRCYIKAFSSNGKASPFINKMTILP